MICVGCRKGFHDGCRGGTHCPCQHRAGAAVRGHRADRWGQWLEKARVPHETGCAHTVMYPAPCDCKPLELDALMELTQMAQEDGLGDHGPDL